MITTTNTMHKTVIVQAMYIHVHVSFLDPTPQREKECLVGDFRLVGSDTRSSL